MTDDQSRLISRASRVRGRRGPYMPDPPTRVRLDMDELGARILHGIVTEARPGFFGPAADRVGQIVDALEEQL